MKAIVFHAFGGADQLRLEEIQKPVPGDNEALIKIAYAGVNPVDWKIREGYLQERIPHEFPIIPGWDVSGTVTEIGKAVKNIKIGDEVYAYARKLLVKWGTYAEYIALEAQHVAIKPKNISFAEAAAVPLASLTAWQSLFDAAHFQSDETILITAGSGGVGSVAIQLAKNAGAKKIAALASPKNYDHVKKLGADIVIDYKADFVSLLKEHFKEGVDVVFDCAEGETFKKSLSSIKHGGRIVSILEKIDLIEATKLQITAHYVFVEPNGEELKAIATLIEENKIASSPIEEMPLKNAADAQEKLRLGKVLGKLVLKI